MALLGDEAAIVKDYLQAVYPDWFLDPPKGLRGIQDSPLLSGTLSSLVFPKIFHFRNYKILVIISSTFTN